MLFSITSTSLQVLSRRDNIYQHLWPLGIIDRDEQNIARTRVYRRQGEEVPISPPACLALLHTTCLLCVLRMTANQ